MDLFTPIGDNWGTMQIINVPYNPTSGPKPTGGVTLVVEGRYQMTALVSVMQIYNNVC